MSFLQKMRDFRSIFRVLPFFVVGMLAVAVCGTAIFALDAYHSWESRTKEAHRSVTGFKLLIAHTHMHEAAFRYELGDPNIAMGELVIRAQRLYWEIQSLETKNYAQSIVASNLSKELARLQGLAAIADQIVSGSAASYPSNFAETLIRERPTVEAIARAVHDENDNLSKAMQDNLKRDAIKLFILTLLFVASFIFLIGIEWSRRKHLLEKTRVLEISEAKLRDLSFYRQQFLANMSHEFRTPLNAIQGFSEAILIQKDTIKREQILEYVDIVHRSAKDLGNLTEDVLDLSKIDAGKFDIYREDVDFTQLIDDAIVQFQAIADQREIKITKLIEADWLVDCDRMAIKRCITNVIGNAMKFSETNDTILVNAYLRDNRVMVVEIRDEGCGIPERDLQSIWMVYARSSLTRKSDREGAGLGLALVKALMDEHNGFVELQSRVGIGTSVRLCFPLSMIVATSKGGKPERFRRSTDINTVTKRSA